MTLDNGQNLNLLVEKTEALTNSNKAKDSAKEKITNDYEQVVFKDFENSFSMNRLEE